MTSPPKTDFDKTKFLYWLLAGVFAWQLSLLTAAGVGCLRSTSSSCDEFPQRYESTFALVISTVLALLAPAPLK